MEVLAALPYLTLPTIPLGPIDLQPFGILVATGVLFGSWIIRKRAEYLLLDEDKIRSMVGWIAVFGFVGAHVFDAIFYQWDKLVDDPLLILKIWEGISSYGGFLGAVAGFFAFAHVHKVDRLAYADALVWGGLPGFTFGRLGCTIVHDHPGRESDFFLAIDYPASRGASLEGARHDLGLYEFLFLLVLIFALWVVARGWRRRIGFTLGFTWISYGIVRFFLDYLRLNAHDPRYFGLTFAQYVSVMTVVGASAVMWWVYHRPPELELAPAKAASGGATVGKGGGASASASKKKRKGKKRKKK